MGGHWCWLVSNVRPWVGTSAHSQPSLQGLKVPVTALVLSQRIQKQEAEGFKELRVSDRELSVIREEKSFSRAPSTLPLIFFWSELSHLPGSRPPSLRPKDPNMKRKTKPDSARKGERKVFGGDGKRLPHPPHNFLRPFHVCQTAKSTDLLC